MSSIEIMSEPSDEELVESIRQGDRDAFRKLHARHAAQLLATFRTCCPPGIDVDDLLQDVWLRVFNTLETFHNQHFRGWLFKIAWNRLYDLTGRKSHKMETVMGDSFDPAEVLEDDDPRIDAIRDCLKKLDGIFIQTIRCVKFDGVKPEDLAAKERVSRNTIDTRISRGVQQLGDCVRGKLS